MSHFLKLLTFAFKWTSNGLIHQKQNSFQ